MRPRQAKAYGENIQSSKSFYQKYIFTCVYPCDNLNEKNVSVVVLLWNWRNKYNGNFRWLLCTFSTFKIKLSDYIFVDR